MAATPHKTDLVKSEGAFIKQLAVVLLLLNLSVLFLAGLSLYKSRQQFTKQATVTTQNLSHVLERYINGELGKTDVALLAIVAETEGQIAHGGIDVQTLVPYTKRQYMELADMDGFRITNARGDFICGVGIVPKNPVSAADYDFFIRLRNGPNLKKITSKPLKSRISGKWVIVVARRINQPDGSFAGIVTASVELEKLYQIFSSIDIGKQGSIILRSEDLSLAVRYPELQGFGRIVSSKSTRELQSLVKAGRTAGTYQARSPQDDIERSYSFRKIAGQPYFIIVGLATDDYLSEWRKELTQAAALITLFCLVTSFLTLLLYRELKRRNSAIMELIRQEAKYHTIADYTYAWEFWLSPDGSFIYSSPACQRVTGYDADAFYSDPNLLRDIVHPDDKKIFADHRHESSSDPNALNRDLRICHADGTVRWLEHDCLPIYDHSGIFLGTRGSNRDVTDRKQMEEALKESEEHFHQLFTQNWDAVMLLHPDTFAVIDANPALLALFGYSMKELQDLGPWPLIAPGTTKQFTNLFQDAILLGESFFEKGISICKDETKIYISAKIKLIRLREQNVLYCSIRDISDRIRLETDKAETQSKLIHANKMTSLGMLVSGIAHEINNPNQYISLNASILADVWKDASDILSRYHEEHGEFSLKGMSFNLARETVPRLLTGVTDGSQRINLIVSNLKDFSRDNSKQLQATFDLNRTIQAAVQILTHHIHKHTYDFQVDLGANIPPVKGKAHQIEQVVINLITNALQALPDKTKGVHLVTAYEQETDSVVLTVCDQGKGMTKEILERVTEPFFSTRLEEGGTGLGLSISATLLKEHGGTLEFESRLDFGTTATIKLQTSPKNSQAPTGANPAAEGVVSE